MAIRFRWHKLYNNIFMSFGLVGWVRDWYKKMIDIYIYIKFKEN